MARQDFFTLPSDAYTVLYPERQPRERCPHRRSVDCNCANIIKYSPYTLTSITRGSSSPMVYTYSQNHDTSYNPPRAIGTAEPDIQYVLKNGHQYNYHRSHKTHYTSPLNRVKYQEAVYSDGDHSSDEPYGSRKGSPYRNRARSPEVKSKDRHHKRRRSSRSRSRDGPRVAQHKTGTYTHEPRRSSGATNQCSHSNLEGLMAGGLHPKDEVPVRRKRHDGLVQDDFGIWHECNEKKKRDTRRVHWPDESDDELDVEVSPHRRKSRHRRSGRRDQ